MCVCVSHFPSFSLPFPLRVSLFIPPSYLTFQVCLPCAPADGPSQRPVQFVSASSRLGFWPQLSTLHPSVSRSPNSCTETSPTKVFLPKPEPRRFFRLQKTHPLGPKPALGAASPSPAPHSPLQGADPPERSQQPGAHEALFIKLHNEASAHRATGGTALSVRRVRKRRFAGLHQGSRARKQQSSGLCWMDPSQRHCPPHLHPAIGVT